MNNTFDIALYGHITLDRIFTNFKESHDIGAMGNVWESLVKLNPSLSISLNPSAFGEALILVDREKCTRYGKGDLNLKTITPTIQNSKWHHILYLNHLKNPKFIAKLNGTISVDVCRGKMDNLEYLKYVDYLFISDEDLFMDITELATKVKGWVILHSPTGSQCYDGKKSFKTNTELIANLNVLGAGDMFAASFISNMLSTNSIKNAVSNAHQQTSTLLKNKSKLN